MSWLSCRAFSKLSGGAGSWSCPLVIAITATPTTSRGLVFEGKISLGHALEAFLAAFRHVSKGFRAVSAAFQVILEVPGHVSLSSHENLYGFPTIRYTQAPTGAQRPAAVLIGTPQWPCPGSSYYSLLQLSKGLKPCKTMKKRLKNGHPKALLSPTGMEEKVINTIRRPARIACLRNSVISASNVSCGVPGLKRGLRKSKHDIILCIFKGI